MEHTSLSYSRAKRKFPQVEDMPGTQTLVNLVFNSQRMQARFSLPQKNDRALFQQMFGDVRFICMGGTPQVKQTHDYYESNFCVRRD